MLCGGTLRETVRLGAGDLISEILLFSLRSRVERRRHAGRVMQLRRNIGGVGPSRRAVDIGKMWWRLGRRRFLLLLLLLELLLGLGLLVVVVLWWCVITRPDVGVGLKGGVPGAEGRIGRG